MFYNYSPFFILYLGSIWINYLKTGADICIMWQKVLNTNELLIVLLTIYYYYWILLTLFYCTHSTKGKLNVLHFLGISITVFVMCLCERSLFIKSSIKRPPSGLTVCQRCCHHDKKQNSHINRRNNSHQTWNVANRNEKCKKKKKFKR